MCGIVGYIDFDSGKKVILTGLKRLEYRGYDSAGIAFLNHSGFRVFKEIGLVSQLIQKNLLFR